MFRRSTLIFTTFVLTLLLSPVAAEAQVEQVTLRVDGLACPFCAYGLEKKVSKLEGYVRDSYTVKINQGMVSFGWRNDKPLDLGAIETAVDKAGFTLRGVTGRVVGTLEKTEDEYMLRSLGPIDLRFVLQEPSSDSGGFPGPEGVAASGDQLKERLERMTVEGNAVEIVGRFLGGSEDGVPGRIGVSDLAALEPPGECGGRFVLEVKDLQCGRCVTRVVRALAPLADVLHVRADYKDDRVEICTRSESPDFDAVRGRIEALGFDVGGPVEAHERSGVTGK